MSGLNGHNKNGLPNGWKWLKLQDIGKIVSGGTPSTKVLEYWGDEIDWITPADLSGYSNKHIAKGRKSISQKGLQNSSAKLLPKGSVLFSSRAPIGYVAIAANDLCTNQGFKNIIPNSEINNEYLYYYLKASKDLAEKNASGTTFKEISASKFSELPIPVPPIVKQKQIVAKIEELFSELDKSIEQLKTTQQQLKVYRQSVLKWAFEGKLTNENVKDGELPWGWQAAKLGEILDVLTDYHANGSYVKLKENVVLMDQPNHAIMIRATNFEKDDFTNNLKYISESAYDFLNKSKLYGEEILIGKIGNAGKVYFMPKLNQPASLAMNLFALRFNKDVISKYIYYHLLSDSSNTQIKSLVKGVGNPTIDKKAIRSLDVMLPSKEEQKLVIQEIESRLSVADNLEETITNSLQQAEALRQSILKKAFEGELI